MTSKRITALLAFLLPFALYAFTAHRHVGLPDWAVLADAMARPELSTAAWNHPLTNLLGWLFTHGAHEADFPSRMVWVSILPMSAAVGVFTLALVRAGMSRPIALACGMIHAVGHSVWWHGTVAENYAISSLFLSLSLYWGVGGTGNRRKKTARRFSCGAPLFFVAGLSLANHVENAVLSLGAVAWLLVSLVLDGGADWRTRVSAVLRAAGAWLAGASLFIGLLACDAWAHEGAFALLAGGGFRRQMLQFDMAQMWCRLFDLFVLEYPSPFVEFAVPGLVAAVIPFMRALNGESKRDAKRNAPSWATLPSRFRWQCFAIATPALLFSLTYDAWDRFAFFLPVFTVCDFLGSVVLSHVFHGCAPSAIWPRRSAALPNARVAKVTDGQLPLTYYLLPFACCLVLFSSILLPPFIYTRIPRWAGEGGDGYWASRFGGIARQYEGRAEMVGMIADPVFHDRGTFERHAMALVEVAPPGALIVDDMSFQHQIDWIRRATWVMRNDLKTVSVVPPFLEGYGIEPEVAAPLIALGSDDVILSTTNGLCGEVVERLRAYHVGVEPFMLPDGGKAFRVVR